jgi:hypothetical protein
MALVRNRPTVYLRPYAEPRLTTPIVRYAPERSSDRAGGKALLPGAFPLRQMRCREPLRLRHVCLRLGSLYQQISPVIGFPDSFSKASPGPRMITPP